MADILIIEDELVLARSIATMLERRGFVADYAVDGAAARTLLNRNQPRLVILDYRLERENGLDLLSHIRSALPETHVVMMTGHADIDVAVQAMKAGARDFLVKPVPLAVIAGLAHDIVLGDLGSVTDPKGAERIIGRSSATSEIRSSVRRLAELASRATDRLPGVLVSGPNGAGKTTVALALAETIGSATGGPPPTLVDCREPGAEAAVREACQRGGTLVLKRIEAIDAAAQGPLAACFARPDSPLVITTAGESLVALERQGRFDPNLLYRVQVGWIDVPSLAARPSDILPLAEHFARAAARKLSLPRPRLSANARARLVGHGWPGNVTELANVMDRAMLVGSQEIDVGAIRFLDSDKPSVPNLRRMEEEALEKALEATQGNVTKAAELLGITRDTMRYRMEKFGLTRG